MGILLVVGIVAVIAGIFHLHACIYYNTVFEGVTEIEHGRLYVHGLKVINPYKIKPLQKVKFHRSDFMTRHGGDGWADTYAVGARIIREEK